MSETILIAEDNNDSREMLRVFLEYKGYRVIEARDGRVAEAGRVALWSIADSHTLFEPPAVEVLR